MRPSSETRAGLFGDWVLMLAQQRWHAVLLAGSHINCQGAQGPGSVGSRPARAVTRRGCDRRVARVPCQECMETRRVHCSPSFWNTPSCAAQDAPQLLQARSSGLHR